MKNQAGKDQSYGAQMTEGGNERRVEGGIHGHELPDFAVSSRWRAPVVARRLAASKNTQTNEPCRLPGLLLWAGDLCRMGKSDRAKIHHDSTRFPHKYRLAIRVQRVSLIVDDTVVINERCIIGLVMWDLELLGDIGIGRCSRRRIGGRLVFTHSGGGRKVDSSSRLYEFLGRRIFFGLGVGRKRK